MESKLMNSEKSQTFDSNRFILNLTDKTNLIKPDKHIALQP